MANVHAASDNARVRNFSKFKDHSNTSISRDSISSRDDKVRALVPVMSSPSNSTMKMSKQLGSSKEISDPRSMLSKRLIQMKRKRLNTIHIENSPKAKIDEQKSAGHVPFSKFSNRY